jgi:hypothetical protein
MPMVNGMKFPYDKEGKKAAKKAAVAEMRKKSGKKMPKKNFSGVKSQVYGAK